MRQRLLVHDYSGHPFQAQLSRRLAGRGHEVLHVYSRSVLTPQGALARTEGDPAALSFHPLSLPAVIDKQAYVRRWRDERAYGRLLARTIRDFRPDAVISSNTPLDAQAAALRAARSAGSRFVFWLQDLQGVAIGTLLGARYGLAGRLAGRYYSWKEKSLLRASDAVVAISEDFCGVLSGWGVDPDAVQVIPNWASLEELAPRPRDNRWARAHGLGDKFCFLYSGTLGLKHDAGLLLELALAYRARPDVCVAVISEGAKAQWLAQRKAELQLENLRLFPFQRYAVLPDVIGSADVLVALLDSDAGAFSVPSKVLSYHCARRPMLLSMPRANLAARIVRQAGSGLIADAGDLEGFLGAAEALRRSGTERERMAANALDYARRSFNVDRIAERFESLFAGLVSPHAEEQEALADGPA